MRDKIPNRIVEKAVGLWCNKLNTPVFDNGDESSTGGLTFAMATINIENAKNRISDMDARIEVFRKSLTDNINCLQDTGEYFSPWLDVDYNPCELLSSAATDADIPRTLFSCKSTVIMEPSRAVTCFGYGAENTYHYPLSDNRWLVTTLSGSGIKDIIDHIENGSVLVFDIEK